jgi:phospholipase C
VIVIIGENHTFDNVFATYKPPEGEKVRNLRSEGIVVAKGDPGPNVGDALQQTASDTTADGYQIDPKDTGAYSTLPQPDTTYVSKACDGLNGNSPDTRFPTNLTNAPYQITKYVPNYDDHGQYAGNGVCEFNGAYVGDPLHRFYQMYQEISNSKNDLGTWARQTAGDDNGANPPATIHQGALEMGFYNVAAGDAPTFNYLARHYSMSDNYHQSVMGGTGQPHHARDRRRGLLPGLERKGHPAANRANREPRCEAHDQ